MIKPVGQAMTAAIEAAKLRETKAATPVAAKKSDSASTSSVVTNPLAQMAQEGSPIDMEKIQRIKQAIASGNYPVDPEKIAEKMVDLDLPRSFN